MPVYTKQQTKQLKSLNNQQQQHNTIIPNQPTCAKVGREVNYGQHPKIPLSILKLVRLSDISL